MNLKDTQELAEGKYHKLTLFIVKRLLKTELEAELFGEAMPSTHKKKSMPITEQTPDITITPIIKNHTTEDTITKNIVSVYYD